MPLVNGYSDYIPPDFYEHVMLLAPFPSRDAFKILEAERASAMPCFTCAATTPRTRNDVLTRLKEFEPYLRPLLHETRRRGCCRDRGLSAVRNLRAQNSASEFRLIQIDLRIDVGSSLCPPISNQILKSAICY